MSKSKARRDRENKRSLTAAQEVLYQRAFKKADRAGGFAPRNPNA
ncbi:YfhE family protein [Calidifontibacillus erzurumensis]|uniref:YfhE family protein n=1 Tax=Calidifontibacillus erzurumensis TaxID=2741433 RepID=A0A8J8GFC8_9BACI|nr:YfhE family protein [Calidifontibacillus erzurumensis]NSL52136.1 YfhE family protein [Calidifontibacillus erzurumensis]